MTFLPEGYTVPDAKSGYMKFKQGENRFRVLGSAIIGWESWIDTEDGRRPIRWRMEETKRADEIGDTANHFWAFPVWNYQEEKIQILEITQKGIQRSIRALTNDKDWGDPKEYDIVVTREGEGLETNYQVQPKPHKKLDEGIKVFYKDLNINLEALYEGKDPFTEEIDTDEVDKAIKEAGLA